MAGGDRNFHWWFLMVGLAQSAMNLADVEWAGRLYDLIAPYADHNCRGGQATFLGAASMQLGALSLLLERGEAAVRHLESALARHHEMGAWPFAAMTEHLLAAALRTPGAHHDEARADLLEDAASATAEKLGVPRTVSPPPR